MPGQTSLIWCHSQALTVLKPLDLYYVTFFCSLSQVIQWCNGKRTCLQIGRSAVQTRPLLKLFPFETDKFVFGNSTKLNATQCHLTPGQCIE